MLNARALALLIASSIPLFACAVTRAPAKLDETHEHTSSIRILLGQRSLDENDWEPVEDQFTFGIDGHRGLQDSALGIEGGFAFSSDEETEMVSVPSLGTVPVDITGSTTEGYLGLRITGMSEENTIWPYAGVGIAVINAEVEAEVAGFSASLDDSSAAGYAHAGVALGIGERAEVGFDLRALFGSSLEFDGVEGDADYFQFAVTLGFRF